MVSTPSAGADGVGSLCTSLTQPLVHGVSQKWTTAIYCKAAMPVYAGGALRPALAKNLATAKDQGSDKMDQLQL